MVWESHFAWAQVYKESSLEQAYIKLFIELFDTVIGTHVSGQLQTTSDSALANLNLTFD